MQVIIIILSIDCFMFLLVFIEYLFILLKPKDFMIVSELHREEI